jgi:MFS family permease
MRGVALSIYMTVYYAAQSAGQLFLDFFDPKSLFPFCFAVILASIAVLPLSITKTKAPIIEEHSVMSFRKLLKVSPLAIIGALFAGLILGPIYGLLPTYAQNVDYSTSQIAWIMGAIIFGGLIFQWPIGTVSDKIDRRKVLCGAAIFTGGLTLIIALIPQMEFLPFLSLTTVLGGFCFTLYPLSISHACDQVESHNIIAATGGILLVYGIGSIIGPIFASYTMQIIGNKAFFIFLAIIGFGLAGIAFARILIGDKVPIDEKFPYANVPQTTPIAFELDARTDKPLENQTPSETKQ